MQGCLSVERMCRVAAVSRAGFYRWLEPLAPVEEEMEVRAAIQAVVLKDLLDHHAESHPAGSLA